MRRLLLILTIFTACSAGNEKWFIWVPENRETTKKIIRENPHLINFLPPDNIDEHLVNFHLIDVDNDKDLDIAYHGWSGAESNCIRYFINKNGKFVSSAFAWGNLKTVTKSETGNFIMNIKLPGCCGDFETRDYKVETIVRKDSLELKFLEVTIHHEVTKSPEKLFDTPIDFKVVNALYYLRVTPEIDTTEWYFPSDGYLGNAYLTYETGDRGKAIGQHTDNTGRVWWYVEMEPNKKHLRFEDNGLALNPQFVGWMSSKYLKKI